MHPCYIDQRFQSKSAVTQRTIELAEAFGLGIDEEREFVVYDHFQLDINPRDVVYVTGESGGGKSLLLKALHSAMRQSPEFGRVVADREIEICIRPDEILAESVGADTKEAVTLLSATGLSEPYLMLRRYRELSEGQKYRYRLAKALHTGADTLLFDEFCSVLDRTTGAVVAHTLQKICRRLQKTVVVCARDPDLIGHVRPDVVVTKMFGAEVEVRRNHAEWQAPCSLLQEVTIRAGTVHEYNQRFRQYHYLHDRPLNPGLIHGAWVAELHGRTIGIIVYGQPHPQLRGRSLALPQFHPGKWRSKSRLLRAVNQSISRIWRVVVLPPFRSIGLAVRLVRETLPLVGLTSRP